MKKILFIVGLIIAFAASSQTQIRDTSTLRFRTNADIIPNNNGSITATKLNAILNGVLNSFGPMFAGKVDSVWSSADQLFVRKNGTTYTYTLTAGIPYSTFLDSLSRIQTRLNSKPDTTLLHYKQNILGYVPENPSNKGIANGYAPIGADGIIPSTYLPFASVVYKDVWNANTNTPTLANGVGTAGWYYICYFAGTQNLGAGSISYNVGDQLIYNGTVWKRVPSAVSVNSINGFTGTVVLTTNNIAESGTNYYWTSARSRNAIGLTNTGTSGMSTYDAGTGIFNIPNYTLAGLGGVAASDTAAMLSNYYRTHVAVAALALKLNISDSAAMMLAYKIKDISHDASIAALVADSATLAARFANVIALANTKLAIADTSNMLNVYLLKNIAQDASILTKLNISDTASMLSAYRLKDIAQDASILTKLNKSDTASMLDAYKAAFIASSFDTTTRVLTLRPIAGSVVSVLIPRGSASGATGISALSSSKTGNIVTVGGDNGSTTQFSINTSDSATRLHWSDTTVIGTRVYADNLANTKLNYRTFGSAANNATTDFTASNTAITAGTKTKITYDTKGLVTAGADATTADIASSTDKRYLTDAQLVVVGNTSGTNTGDNAVNTRYSSLVTMTYPAAGIAVSTGSAWTTSITDNSSNWNTAYTDRNKWDGGSTGLTAATGRASLGLVIGTDVLAYRTFGTAANNATGDFAAYNAVHYVGTTSIAANRASGSQTLTGVSIDGNSATTSQTNFSALTVSSVAVVVTTDSRMTDSRNAADVYAWAKASVKPTYAYSEITGTPTIPTVYAWAQAATKPSYIYSEIGGTVPTWNQNTTGTAANITATSNSTLVTASALTTAAGGAFGSNAYTSTAYLPLSGGTLTGMIYVNTTGIGATSQNSNSFAFNRDVSSGAIFTNTGFAYQWQRTYSTTATSDFLALQVYQPNGTSVTTGAISVNGLGNVSLTGALTGTSATFSGNTTGGNLLTAGGVYSNTWYANTGTSLALRSASAAVIADFSTTTATFPSTVTVGAGTSSIGGSLYMGGKVSIGSSNVTAASLYIQGDGSVSNIRSQASSSENLFDGRNSSGTLVYSIASSGALTGTSATFSSNTTVGNLLTSGAVYSNAYFSNSGSTIYLYTASSAAIATMSNTAATFPGTVSTTGLNQGTGTLNYNANFYTGGAAASYVQVTNGSTGSGSGNGILVGLDGTGNAYFNQQSNFAMYLKTNNTTAITISSTQAVTLANTFKQGTGSTIKFGTISPSSVSLTTGVSYNIPITIDGTTYYLRLFTGTD